MSSDITDTMICAALAAWLIIKNFKQLNAISVNKLFHLFKLGSLCHQNAFPYLSVARYTKLKILIYISIISTT